MKNIKQNVIRIKIMGKEREINKYYCSHMLHTNIIAQCVLQVIKKQKLCITTLRLSTIVLHQKFIVDHLMRDKL